MFDFLDAASVPLPQVVDVYKIFVPEVKLCLLIDVQSRDGIREGGMQGVPPHIDVPTTCERCRTWAVADDQESVIIAPLLGLDRSHR